MRKWFTNVTTIEKLRKRYRELLKKYHPDNENGSVEVTQEINAEYDIVFSILSKEEHSDSQSYTQEENEQFKAILNAIIGYNITIEIIGNWIWCFNCYAYKDQLKSLGFTWCSKKKAWVWHSGEYHRHHKKEIPLNDIRAKYGSQTVRNQSYQYSLN
ncbi:MAG: J domain-containing protein [Lachnospiraceae bacterium]